MEQDEPGHAKYSSEQMPDHNDPEGRVHQTAPGQEHSPDDDPFIIPEERVGRDNLHRKLMATARSLKKQKQRLKAAQETLNRRWNKVLDTEERYGDDRNTTVRSEQSLGQTMQNSWHPGETCKPHA